jgi:deazaflavin-dependent oxidoreductase (nitroreductase family)
LVGAGVYAKVERVKRTGLEGSDMSEHQIPSSLPGWIAEHVKLYKSDPEKAHLWDSSLGGGKGMLTTLLLTTKGRKSGKDISIPLIYAPYGSAFVVIASKGGSPDHPAWYKNLLADPDCDIQVSTKGYRARARTAQGEEREKLWQQLQALYPPYDDYQKRAQGREIPVVVLEPVAAR